jgi:transposase, IS30 family
MAVQRWAKNAGMTLRIGRHGGVRDREGGALAVAPGLLEDPLQGRDLLEEFEGGDQDWTDQRGQLTEAGRGLIAFGVRHRWSKARIARELGVHRATVGRELRRHRVGGVYSARVAQGRTVAGRARPQQRKLDRACQVFCVSDLGSSGCYR